MQKTHQLLQNIPKTVTIKQNNLLTKPVNKSEIKEATFQMENQKFPGIDGRPIEFYKELHNVLENNLHQLYNDILFHQKQPPKTMNQALIILIPKNANIKNLKY